MKSLKIAALCFSFLLIGCTQLAFAQEKTDAQVKKKVQKNENSEEQRIKIREKLVSSQIAEINKRLSLDEATAAKFEKLYNDYISDLNTFRDETKKVRIKFSENISAEDADKLIQQRFDRDKKIIEIKEKHFAKFKTVLSAKQILTVYAIENETHQKIAREHHQRFGKDTKKDHQKKK